ncbi:MAG TPA: hypothetical protein VFF69_11995 [Phycisphaerales bacterium]|nr:hypothetical protein [Phycisphaerales bacterium]
MHGGYDLFTVPGIWDARETLASQHVHYADCRETLYLAANMLHPPASPGRVEGLGELFTSPDRARENDGFLYHDYPTGNAHPNRLYGRWLEATAGEPWESMQRALNALGAHDALEPVRAAWGRHWRPAAGRAEPVWLWFVIPKVERHGKIAALVRFIDAVPARVFEAKPAAHWGKLSLIVAYACGEQA